MRWINVVINIVIDFVTNIVIDIEKKQTLKIDSGLRHINIIYDLGFLKVNLID